MRSLSNYFQGKVVTGYVYFLRPFVILNVISEGSRLLNMQLWRQVSLLLFPLYLAREGQLTKC